MLKGESTIGRHIVGRNYFLFLFFILSVDQIVKVVDFVQTGQFYPAGMVHHNVRMTVLTDYVDLIQKLFQLQGSIHHYLLYCVLFLIKYAPAIEYASKTTSAY